MPAAWTVIATTRSLAAHFATDVRRGVRSLGRSPGFAAAAVATLALGIGANSAMFSVVNAVLLRPLPYDRPESRVMLWSRWQGFDKTWVSDAEVLDYGRLCPSLKQVAAWSGGQANLTGDGEAIRVGAAQVTSNLFATLGAKPALGRVFTLEEEAPGADAVVVLGHGLWRQRYGGDVAILDRTVLLDGVARKVVGVMPRGFALPTDFGEDAAEPTALWTPLRLDPDPGQRGNHGLYAVAELSARATAEQASAELDALSRSWTKEGLYPESMQFRPFAVSLPREILGSVRGALLLLLGAVVFLLLITCANVANLLLARAEVRQREVALRAALGAGQARLLGQLLAESLVLAVPGAVLGLAVAWASLRLLLGSGATGLPRSAEVTIDGSVLAFTAAVALAATLLFSLAPALRTLRLSLTESLREGGPGATVGGRGHAVRGLLVVAETALSVVLLLGAGLLLRSLWALQATPLGFGPEGVLTARVSVPEVGYEAPEKVVAFYRSLLERARALPGVTEAGLLRSLPLGAQIGDWGLAVEGFVPAPGINAKGDWQVASDGALEALGERVVKGRGFTAHDTADGQQVALVNETMARTYWPGTDPIDKRFRMGSNQERPWVTVVGVVADVRHNGVRTVIKEKFYRPHSQFHVSTGFTPRAMTVVLKSAGDPRLLAGPLRQAVRALDPNVPVAAVRPMTEVVADSLTTPRLAGALLALFAAVALALAAVGTYGVLSYLVGHSTQEIGIRMAIGAAEADVLRLVLGRGMRLSLTGIALGGLGALGLARLLGSLLHDVQPYDPATFLLVPGALALVALAACYLPAARAARVDPTAALRAE